MRSLYIANRGEIACRIIRTARAMGIRTIVGYSEADAGALFVEQADEAHLLGQAQPSESYLKVDTILSILQKSGADAVHPGYGFLSENSSFAAQTEALGVRWVGPSGAAIEAMGDKERARAAMAAHQVPLVPGVNNLDGLDAVRDAANRLGYPVLIKAALGGGGIGMKAIDSPDDLAKGWEESVSRAERAFGSGRVYVEKLVQQPHHVEVQVFGTAAGEAFTLFERECSVQRRHQKVAEESPSPFATDRDREVLYEAALRGTAGISYQNAGTMEFLLSGEHAPYFLEMNTRLQVEHPVTELVTGLDLVALQLRTAMGDNVGVELANAVTRGHALEFRLYAENPKNFYPAPGTIDKLIWPEGEGIRIDTGVRQGDTITPFYDPMIAKISVHAETRPAALKRMRQALAGTILEGLKSNLPFLVELLDNPSFSAGTYDTNLIQKMRPKLK